MRKILSIAVATALVAFSASAAQPLLPAGGTDQVPAKLSALPAPSLQVERAPVRFSWKLDPATALYESAPAVAESREFWQTVDAADLQRGVALKLSAPGSLIRNSPAAGARGLPTDSLKLQGTRGPAKLERLLDARQLKAAGMEVGTGTVMAKLAPEAGAGSFTLSAAEARGRYVVHVFEPASTDVLSAKVDRDRALAGGQIRLDVNFARAGRSVNAGGEALLVSPDGRSWPVKLAAAGSGLRANVQLPKVASSAPGLWELQVFTDADGIQRDARTAFAVAQPTARFGGRYDFDATKLQMALPLVAASAGRYEARGQLYATAPDGILRPVSQAHSAAWFERGGGTLTLAFERSHLPQGYGAPFEVRQLELFDQSRMAPLEKRARAGRIDGPQREVETGGRGRLQAR